MTFSVIAVGRRWMVETMRLIDADYLKVKGHYDDYDVFVVDYDDIKNAPTIDHVKRGRWIYGEDETIEDGGWCSVCYRDQPTFWVDKAWRYVETRYCPHCGALMDEDG